MGNVVCPAGILSTFTNKCLCWSSENP